jgi:hypothetical protein
MKTLIAAGIAAVIAGYGAGHYMHYHSHWGYKTRLSHFVDSVIGFKERIVKDIAVGYLENTIFAPIGRLEWNSHPAVQHFFGSTRAYMVDMNHDGHDDIILTIGKAHLVFLRIPQIVPNSYSGFMWDKTLNDYRFEPLTSLVFGKEEPNKGISLDDCVSDLQRSQFDCIRY